MDNPFTKLKPAILGNIMSRCDIADMARMRCTDRALASILKLQSVRKKICEWKQINNEYGYSLIIFQKQNSDEIRAQKAVRAREVHLIKAGYGVVMLEKEVTHRRRLVVYEGGREAFNLGQLWHKDSKLPSNESSVLSFTSAENVPKYTVMKTNDLEWKWTEQEACHFTHPTFYFSFILEGGMFLKVTSMLPQMPLPLRFANSVSHPPYYMVGTELLDVNTKRQIAHRPLSWGLPHVAFELKHVFEWGDGIIYMLFVGDRNNGQVDLGSWMIEDMPPERLEFAVFYSHKVTGPIEFDKHCQGISDWLKRFLLPQIYAAPSSARFDQVELISLNKNDLLILRREKSGAWILVNLWLERENSWANPVQLIAQGIVSFCLWRLNAQYFHMDCILVVAKLRDVEAGAWWIVQKRGMSAAVVSQGMLQGISDGARFSLVRHLQVKS